MFKKTIYIFLTLIGIWLGGHLLGVIFYNFFDPSSSAYMRAEQRILSKQNNSFKIQQEWIDSEQISDQMKKAVIASEDSGFYKHNGFEWQDIKKAWAYNRQQASQGSSKRRGASTISQQVAKNLFLRSDRSYWRKLNELIITLMMETIMSKDRILTLYLNIAEFGTGVFGVEAAAKHYFKMGAKQLNAQQAARLTVLLPNPKGYGKNLYGPYMNSRTNTIVARMRSVRLEP